MPASIEYVRAGKLRALAVSTATRSQALPDLPTVSEFVPGYESSGYFGFGAPARTPAEIIDKLNKEINAGLADPKLKAQLADLGGMILAGSPADFRKLIDRRNREVGQGDPGGQHQGGVSPPIMVKRTAAMAAAGTKRTCRAEALGLLSGANRTLSRQKFDPKGDVSST